MKKNDIVSYTSYAKITSIGTNNVSVIDLNNLTDYSINGKELLAQLVSADDFKSTEKCTKTELADKLANVGSFPFTVVFEKQNGETRTLRGLMLKVENGLGRSNVIDLDLPKADKANRMRQVDHRTLKSLIVNNVKYILKK
jgi:hypothetical protein